MTSRSNVLYDVDCGVTLEDMQSFLRDTQRLDLAVNMYGTITHWHVSDEILELNSHGCAFLCRSCGWASNFIWLKNTIWCGTAAEVSDLNSLYCGNSVPNQF